MVYCLFEQSGTFKNEFKKLGFDAIDYDIENQFGQTDVIIDLFAEIEKGYEKRSSIFDKIDPATDFVVAFFPCTRFEVQIEMAFRGDQWQIQEKNDIEKLTYALQLSEERQKLYTYITHLVMIAEERGIKMMIENPYSEQSYLIKYWPIKPKLIHKNRRLDGDYYEKPTMYYFINCEPQENIILEPLVYHKKRTVETSHGIDRSIISSDYVERFIKRHILGIIGEYKYE